jgi:hypothetical protein
MPVSMLRRDVQCFAETAQRLRVVDHERADLIKPVRPGNLCEAAATRMRPLYLATPATLPRADCGTRKSWGQL